MLGQPISMLLPQVVGFRLTGELSEGATATDLVLTVTEMLRERGVVSKFVEFFGPGISGLGLADRATIGNMSPEFGSTCAIFPIDAETLRYLEFTGRPDRADRARRRLHARAGPLPRPRTPRSRPTATRSSSTSARSSRASPGRSAPRTGSPSPSAKGAFLEAMQEWDPEAGEELGNSRDEAIAESFPASDPPAEDHDGEAGKPAPARAAAASRSMSKTSDAVAVQLESGEAVELDHGHVVIAAITSCTNTSNPSVMLAAGLLAKKAVERGLRRQPWVKTSLAPGSTVVTEYLERSGLDRVPRPAPVQPGRLRLHHLHRQLGAAAGGDLQGRQRQGPRRLLGALRQPQLRGPDQPRHAGELPRIAAAGGRLRARRADGHRPDHRAARARLRRGARSPPRRLAELGGDQAGGRRGDPLRHVHQELLGRLHRRRALAGDRGPGGGPLHVARFHLRPPAGLLRGDEARAGAGGADRRAPGCWRCSATRSPPTTSRPPGRSRGTARPGAG